MTKEEFNGILNAIEDSGYNYKKRRIPEWDENYSLNRGRVQLNRLTQRQTVMLPVMKYALNTLRKDIDDAPNLHFNNLDNDAQQEVYYNESFKQYMKDAKAVIKDIHDKNNAMLFGRTFKKLNICDGKFDFDVVEAIDMGVDRYGDKAKLDAHRSLYQKHIYRAISQLEKMDGWDQKEVERLRTYYASEEGLIKSARNAEEMADKNQRLQELGVPDVNDPVLGETIVELSEYYYYDEDDAHEGEILHVTVRAEDSYNLFKAPLCEVLGDTVDDFWHNHFPYVTWGVDPDATDFWCDGIADVLRMICKIINSWFSQEVENRTLATMGMNFYDSTNKAFVPQTFQPIPFGFYPVPGDPNKVLKSVFPQQLTSNMDGINFLMQIAEKASAATAANQGTVEKGTVTLGEVQLAIANAKDRVKALAVFYNDSWEEFGLKYIKILEGSAHLLDDHEVIKQGKTTTKKYSKIISPADWGRLHKYSCEIKTVTDKTQEDIEAIQKLQAGKQFFTNNQKFDEILKRKAAEFSGLNAEEVEQVMDIERKNYEAALAAQAAMAAGGAVNPDGTPVDPMLNGGQPALPAQAGGGMPPAPPMVN
jgi:hypothetical protein